MKTMLIPVLAGAIGIGFVGPYLAGRYWPDAQERSRGLQVRPGSGPARSSEQRVALVIGNGAYGSAPLRNPVNDARAMAEALRACGFDVIKLEDATRPEMRDAIRQFGDRIAAGGAGLFYFAGHGMQVKGRNYLVPVGASLAREEDLEVETVPLDALLARLEAARNRLNILILDACRNNPFGAALSGSLPGFTPMDAPAGTYMAFSTSPGRTAADGNGENSLYTQALLHQLAVPGLKLEEVFKRTRAEVLLASGQRQTPWENSSALGDFYFRPGAGALEPATMTVQVVPAAIPALATGQAAQTPAVTQLPPPPVAVAQVGGLLVTVNTPGAQVYVNGALEGTASLSSALSVPGLPAGEVQVRVEAQGYAPAQGTFGIEQGQWTQARLTLRRRGDDAPGEDFLVSLTSDNVSEAERSPNRADPWRPGPAPFRGPGLPPPQAHGTR